MTRFADEWSWARVWHGLEWRARHCKDSAREGALSASVWTDDRAPLGLRLEYHLRSGACGLHVWLEDEHTVTLGVQVPLVAQFWLSIDLLNMCWRGPSRALDISIHDSALYWKLFAPMNSWSSSTPRRVDGSWHPLGFHMRQGKVEVLEERDVLVPMTERSYRARAKLTRSRWGLTRLPRAFDRARTHVDIDMLEGEQIPFPGKGENSWDCGDDATFSMHCPALSIEEGIGVLVGSVLRNRHRRGWAPSQAAAE